EATEFNLEDYTQLTLRMRERKHPNKQIFLMFNPVSKLNWVYKYFFEQEQDEDTKIIHSTYKDNAFLDDRTKENLEKLSARNSANDTGYTNDQSAIIDVKSDKQNDALYTMEEYVKTGMLNNEIANMLTKLGYHNEVVTADAAEPKSIE